VAASRRSELLIPRLTAAALGMSAKAGGGDEIVDKLYVKFCLIDDCLVIDLASFHLPRF